MAGNRFSYISSLLQEIFEIQLAELLDLEIDVLDQFVVLVEPVYGLPELLCVGSKLLKPKKSIF